MKFRFRNSSIAYTINAGNFTLVVLLVAVGIFSFTSITKMTSSMSNLNKGMTEVGTDLRVAMVEMGALDESISILKKSEAEFAQLRNMQSSLEESRKNTALVGKELDAIRSSFVNQSNALEAISQEVGNISEEIKLSSGPTQQLILAAEEINSHVLNSYIGFFNYLNEFTSEVEEPLTDIKEILEHSKEITTLLEGINNSGEGLAIVKGIQQDLRRYRRYMRDLGETTSTTQITEIKAPLVEYGNKITESAKQLKEYAWKITEQNNQQALLKAQNAEKTAQSALDAGETAAGIIGKSIQLAKTSSNQIGELTTSLSVAIKGIDTGLNEIPKAISQVSGSMETVKSSMGVMDSAMKTSRSLENLANQTRMLMISVCIGAVIIGLLLGMYVNRKIVAPLSRFTMGLHRASQNDLTVKIDPAGTSGELKDLIEGVNKLIETFANNVKSMKLMASRVRDNARHLNSVANDTSKALNDQSDKSSNIASATVEMSDSSHQVALNSGEASDKARQVTGQLHEGDRVIQEMFILSESISNTLTDASAQVNSLVNDSEKINSIIETINGIANQTNMLALNAAIEAARAGRHGKGFAVVADEVKGLAGQTARSTQDISELLESVQERISLSLRDISECGEQSDLEGKKSEEVISHIAEIRGSIEVLSNQISGIAAATQEQDKTVLTVASSIETISNITQNTFEKMNVIVRQAEELLEAAESLIESVSIYDIKKETLSTLQPTDDSRSLQQQLPQNAKNFNQH